MGPILFLIYINDLDENILNNLTKFADDAKLSVVSNSFEKCQSLQRDIIAAYKWGEKWGMHFNIDKCQSLHIGKNNINFTYYIDGKPLNKCLKQKDLGVIVNNKLKPNSQCVEASMKANKILGFISRTFEFKCKEIVLPLYKSLVRPHLDYAAQFWNPYHVKDISILERVQRRATKLIPTLRSLPYKTRLKRLGLQTLEARRLRGQLIEVFKILNGFDLVNNILVRDENPLTRNNGQKLIGKRFRTDVAKYFFTNRIVDAWNILPANVVASNSINEFKNRLDKYFASENSSDLYRIYELKI